VPPRNVDFGTFLGARASLCQRTGEAPFLRHLLPPCGVRKRVANAADGAFVPFFGLLRLTLRPAPQHTEPAPQTAAPSVGVPCARGRSSIRARRSCPSMYNSPLAGVWAAGRSMRPVRRGGGIIPSSRHRPASSTGGFRLEPEGVAGGTCKVPPASASPGARSSRFPANWARFSRPRAHVVRGIARGARGGARLGSRSERLCPRTFRLDRRSAPFGLRSAHFGLRSARFSSRSAHFRLRSAPFSRRSAHFGLRSAPFSRRSAHFRLRSARVSPRCAHSGL
jgi:hypothetical protein